jgi:hypothetical protein
MGVKITKAYKNCRIGSAIVAGAAANTNIAIAGIKTTDELFMVLELATSTALPTDRLATSSITSDGNIQSTDATDSDVLIVQWISRE